MTKKPTLSDVVNILTASTALNTNWDAIQTSFDNTLSRDGSTPNQMEADIDLNNYDLLNVNNIDVKNLTINGGDFTVGLTDAVAAAQQAADSAAAAALYDGIRFPDFASFVASTDTYVAGRFIEIPSIGAYYQATDGVGTLGQANAGLQEFDVLNVEVRPEMYGAVGDGSDETDELMAMTSHARTRGFLNCTLTEGKTYGYTKNAFLSNIKVISIKGNGANFICLHGTPTYSDFFSNAEGLTFAGPFSTNGPERYEGSLTPYNGGQLVETVSAGSSTFTIPAPEGVPDFSVGDRVLLFGFDAQGSDNFPPCMREFETARVTNIVGQAVTIDRPLLRSYRDDWVEVNSDPATVGGITNGPARVITLNRSVDTFEEIENIYIENLTILANPDWTGTGSTENRNGRLVLGGFKEANLVNVSTGGGCYISVGGTVTWDGGKVFADLSPDKLLNTVHLKNMRLDKISEGIGTRKIICENVRVDTSISLGALEKIQFINCDLPFEDGTTGGAMTSGNLTPQLDILGGRMRVRTSAKKYFTTPGESTAVFTAVDENTLSLPLVTYLGAGSFARAMQVGLVLTNDGEPAFRVGELPYLSGTDVIIPGFTVGPFTSGVTTLAVPNRSYGKVNVTAEIESPYEQSVRPFTGSTLATPRYLKFSGLGFTEDSFELSSEQLPASLDEESGACFGSMGGLWRPTKVLIDVHEAYTGVDPAPFITIREYNKTNATYMTIDTLTTGFRSVSLEGNSAALGADTLPTFSTGLFESWRVTPSPAYTDIDRAKAPKWKMKIIGWRKLP